MRGLPAPGGPKRRRQNPNADRPFKEHGRQIVPVTDHGNGMIRTDANNDSVRRVGCPIVSQCDLAHLASGFVVTRSQSPSEKSAHTAIFLLTSCESEGRLMAYMEGGQSKRCREILPAVHCVRWLWRKSSRSGPQGYPSGEGQTAWDATAFFHVEMLRLIGCTGWRIFQWSNDSVTQRPRLTDSAIK